MNQLSPFGAFLKIHRSTLRDGASLNAMLSFIPENDVPAIDHPTAHVWWKWADDIMRQFGYVPVRFVYKDAADLAATMLDGNETRH